MLPLYAFNSKNKAKMRVCGKQKIGKKRHFTNEPIDGVFWMLSSF